jgi:hypothetical protein
MAMKSASEKLRDLATWYREFAELAENTIIWQSRFRIAEDLEHQADQLIALSPRGGSNGWPRQ